MSRHSTQILLCVHNVVCNVYVRYRTLGYSGVKQNTQNLNPVVHNVYVQAALFLDCFKKILDKKIDPTRRKNGNQKNEIDVNIPLHA